MTDKQMLTSNNFVRTEIQASELKNSTSCMLMLLMKLIFHCYEDENYDNIVNAHQSLTIGKHVFRGWKNNFLQMKTEKCFT